MLEQEERLVRIEDMLTRLVGSRVPKIEKLDDGDKDIAISSRKEEELKEDSDDMVEPVSFKRKS